MRVEGVIRGRALSIVIDGEAVACFEGETVATAMLAASRAVFRLTDAGAPRGLFCNMGTCCECLVWVGDRRLRACLTPATDGMQIATRRP